TSPSAQSKAARAARTFSMRPAMSPCSPMPATKMRTSRAGLIAARRSERAQAIKGMATRPTRLCACSHIVRPQLAPDRPVLGEKRHGVMFGRDALATPIKHPSPLRPLSQQASNPGRSKFARNLWGPPMTTHSLLLLPGDGIGPEVMAEVERLVAFFNKKGKVQF